MHLRAPAGRLERTGRRAMVRVLWRWSLLIAPPMSLLACGSSTEPEEAPAPVWRSYALTHLKAEALPAVYLELPDETIRIVAETLVLREDLTAQVRARIERTPDAGAVIAQSTSETTTYLVRGDSLFLGPQIFCVTFPCPDIRRIGPLTADVAELTFADTITFTYARVPP